MLAGCPVCKARYRLDESRIGDGLKLRCSSCRTIFRIRGAGPAQRTVPPEPEAPAIRSIAKVLIAHDSHSFCAAVKEVLFTEPFEVLVANDGVAAYTAIREHQPEVAVLDVALSGMFGFEICEAVKSEPDTASVKVILIASIYDKTRYKRLPESLYGADDYIEKHHIPDELATRIYRVLASARPVEPAAGAEPPVQDPAAVVSEVVVADIAAEAESRDELRLDEERETFSGGEPPAEFHDEAHQKARRLARLIVSDIALYNQALVQEGVRSGTFFELLQDDVAEGRALYEQRVPLAVRTGTRYLDEAFDDFIQKMHTELNL